MELGLLVFCYVVLIITMMYCITSEDSMLTNESSRAFAENEQIEQNKTRLRGKVFDNEIKRNMEMQYPIQTQNQYNNDDYLCDCNSIATQHYILSGKKVYHYFEAIEDAAKTVTCDCDKVNRTTKRKLNTLPTAKTSIKTGRNVEKDVNPRWVIVFANPANAQESDVNNKNQTTETTYDSVSRSHLLYALGSLIELRE